MSPTWTPTLVHLGNHTAEQRFLKAFFKCRIRVDDRAGRLAPARRAHGAGNQALPGSNCLPPTAPSNQARRVISSHLAAATRNGARRSRRLPSGIAQHEAGTSPQEILSPLATAWIMLLGTTTIRDQENLYLSIAADVMTQRLLSALNGPPGMDSAAMSVIR